MHKIFILWPEFLYIPNFCCTFAAAFGESDCPGLQDIKPENILYLRIYA